MKYKPTKYDKYILRILFVLTLLVMVGYPAAKLLDFVGVQIAYINSVKTDGIILEREKINTPNKIPSEKYKNLIFPSANRGSLLERFDRYNVIFEFTDENGEMVRGNDVIAPFFVNYDKVTVYYPEGEPEKAYIRSLGQDIALILDEITVLEIIVLLLAVFILAKNGDLKKSIDHMWTEGMTAKRK